MKLHGKWMVVFVVVVTTYLSVMIVTVYSAPTIERKKDDIGYCELNKLELSAAEFEEMAFSPRHQSYLGSTLPPTWTEEQRTEYWLDRVAIVRKMLGTKVTELKLLVERTCIQ